MNIKISNWLLRPINVSALVDSPYTVYIDSNVDDGSFFSGECGDEGGGTCHCANQYTTCHCSNQSYTCQCSKSSYSCDCSERSYSCDCSESSYSCNCSEENRYYYASIQVSTSPRSVLVEENETATFTYVVTTGSSVTNQKYQWYYSSSPSADGQVIAGATKSSYRVVASAENNGYYYYCIFTSSQGTMVSSRARLTVNLVRSYDFWVAVGQQCDIPVNVVYGNDVTPQLSVKSIADNTIITSTSNGTVTGLKIGETTIQFTIDGKIQTATVTVIESPLEALFKTTATILRDKNDSTEQYSPSEFAAEIAKTVDDVD